MKTMNWFDIEIKCKAIFTFKNFKKTMKLRI